MLICRMTCFPDVKMTNKKAGAILFPKLEKILFAGDTFSAYTYVNESEWL